MRRGFCPAMSENRANGCGQASTGGSSAKFLRFFRIKQLTSVPTDHMAHGLHQQLHSPRSPSKPLPLRGRADVIKSVCLVLEPIPKDHRRNASRASSTEGWLAAAEMVVEQTTRAVTENDRNIFARIGQKGLQWSSRIVCRRIVVKRRFYFHGKVRSNQPTTGGI